MYSDSKIKTVLASTEATKNLNSDVNSARKLSWEALQKAMPDKDLPAVQECVTRLYSSLSDKDDLGRNTVMVAYGGGKDSAYTTAFMRAVHLAMAERFNGETFLLRIVTMRHSGMPFVVMENIHRTYKNLGVYEDPLSELLLIERNQVRPFALHAPMPQPVIELNRIDFLMSGHRSYGDGRTSFCNACNLNVAHSFGVAAKYGRGVDLIVTGDSPSEQKDYLIWIRRLVNKIGQKPSESKTFKGTLETLDSLSRTYFAEIHGHSHTDRLSERGVEADVPENLSFFSIYDYTDYASGAHWSLLENFLGFVFDDLAFSFTESDCVNPAIMAHLRGLRTEHVYKRGYREGIDQYKDFAISLMQEKEFPEHLIAIIKQRYSTEEGVAAVRTMITQYVEQTFDLTTEQLVCVVYSPFADNCQHLHDYLEREQPDLLDNETEIVALLNGKYAGDLSLAARLERFSGLSLTDLRQICSSPLWSPFETGEGSKRLLPHVTSTDPNQRIIEIHNGTNSEKTLDRVSGR